MESVTARPATSRDRRSERANRLLDATRRLLDEGACFTELGVGRITAEAGVGRSSFYTHFRDKTDLLVRLAATFHDRSMEIVSSWQADDGMGLDALVVLYERVLALHRDQYAVVSAVAEVAAYDAEVRESWNAQLERLSTGARERLVRDQRAGLAPTGLDPDTAVTVIVWGGSHAIVRHVALHDASRDQVFAQELAHIVWYGAFRRPAG